MNRREFIKFSLTAAAAAAALPHTAAAGIAPAPQPLTIHLFGADYWPTRWTTLSKMLAIEVPERVYHPAMIRENTNMVAWAITGTAALYGVFVAQGTDLVAVRRFPAHREVIASDVLEVHVEIVIP